MTAAYFSPAGNTVAVTATTVSTSVQVPSLFPTQYYYVVNTGAQPVQCRFYVNTSTGTATMPVPGTPSLGPVVGSSWSQTFQLPAALTAQLDNGFTTTAVVAVIAPSGTNNVYITPVMGQ
jgi:hypothetical protein